MIVILKEILKTVKLELRKTTNMADLVTKRSIDMSDLDVDKLAKMPKLDGDIDFNADEQNDVPAVDVFALKMIKRSTLKAKPEGNDISLYSLYRRVYVTLLMNAGNLPPMRSLLEGNETDPMAEYQRLSTIIETSAPSCVITRQNEDNTTELVLDESALAAQELLMENYLDIDDRSKEVKVTKNFYQFMYAMIHGLYSNMYSLESREFLFISNVIQAVGLLENKSSEMLNVLTEIFKTKTHMPVSINAAFLESILNTGKSSAIAKTSSEEAMFFGKLWPFVKELKPFLELPTRIFTQVTTIERVNLRDMNRGTYLTKVEGSNQKIASLNIAFSQPVLLLIDTKNVQFNENGTSRGTVYLTATQEDTSALFDILSERLTGGPLPHFYSWSIANSLAPSDMFRPLRRSHRFDAIVKEKINATIPTFVLVDSIAFPQADIKGCSPLKSYTYSMKYKNSDIRIIEFSKTTDEE